VTKITCALLICLVATAAPPAGETWIFDNLNVIGGHKPTVLGHPQIIAAPGGKAVQFNGVDDALFFDTHPLAGVEAFTWEVIFRPDLGGAPEQRFFHLQPDGPGPVGQGDRMLFEIRVIGDQWALDSFVTTGPDSRALLDNKKLHPLGQWYDVAAVYDGQEFRNYVDGVLQGSGPLHVAPQKAGQASVGVRFNKRDYFKGAVREARMTPRALTPAEFLKK
jgi:hypothetical protein